MPGMAASTRLTCSFGPAPKPTAAPENSFEREATWAWTSRPRTISRGPVRPSIWSFLVVMGPYLACPGRRESGQAWLVRRRKSRFGPGSQNCIILWGENQMRKILAIGFMAAALGLSLASVAQAQDMTPAVKSGPPSIDWPIQDLLADPVTLAVITKDLPDLQT